MNSESASVVFVLPDACGGVASIIGNLLRYRKPDELKYHVLLTRDLGETADRPVPEGLAADAQRSVVFERSIDNFNTVLRRMRKSIPEGEGSVVSNDWLGLAAFATHNHDRALLHILHSDIESTYELAIQHDPVVDGFITYSRLIYEKLQRLLPHRRETIFYVPYGVPIPSELRTATTGPIRLLFVARLVRDKGIYELPAIDEKLSARNIQARWTIVGGGPDGETVRDQWQNSRVCWTGVLPNREVLRLYCKHDVLVLPTRMEGFPVSLLEAMAAGVVPVVTDLPGGVQEVVQSGVTGFLHPFSDVCGFAESIAELHGDRAKLEQISMAARQIVQEEFDIRKRVTAYQDLFARWPELRRTDRGPLPVAYGNRLDKNWLPNCLVRTLRRIVRRTGVPTISGPGRGRRAPADVSIERT